MFSDTIKGLVASGQPLLARGNAQGQNGIEPGFPSLTRRLAASGRQSSLATACFRPKAHVRPPASTCTRATSSPPRTGESYFLIMPFTPSGEQLNGSSFRSEG